MGGRPCRTGRVGNRRTGVDTAGCQRPYGRPRKQPLTSEKIGRPGHIDMEALGPLGFLQRHDRRESPAGSGRLFERRPVGNGIIVIDFGHVAGPRPMGDRQHGHGLRQRHPRRNPGDRRSPSGRQPIRPRLHGPGPRHHRHHAASLASADEQRHPAKFGSLEQPPLHRPAWQPERHDARHDTSSDRRHRGDGRSLLRFDSDGTSTARPRLRSIPISTD